ncbi:uncharacterized protein [Spinacia oleracea]|uniref:Integrase catalytic domain-containing protein n=1 Tax=Spinacia oleracea TaxID=3562 RepID=A0ABM3RJ44_SPIOL|nr:uncharacterized protein LOC130470084 [Spinacia oleracea]
MAIENNESESSQANSRGNRNNFDPYFIANSDNPTSTLVVVPFTGVNFVRWSRNVKRALIAENKEVFINGELTKPAINHKDYLKWKPADFMVLKKEIENLTQENMTIVSSYSKLKKLWDEMQTLRAFPTCTCGAMITCSCQFLKKMAEFEEEDKMMKFLLGLNGGFDSIVTNILALDPMPNLNRVFLITQQIKKQQEVSNVDVECNAMSSSAMAAQAYRGGQVQKYAGSHGKKDWKELKKEKLNRICTHCKGKGPTAEQCFKIIGYPDWYNTIKASKGSNSSGGRFAAHVNSTSDVGDDPLDNSVGDTGMVNSAMLNAICQEVMKVMKGKQSHNGDTNGATCSYANYAGTISHSFNCATNKQSDDHMWIVDSGACDHMTYDESILTNIRMTVEKMGDTVLTDSLILNDVLLDPSSSKLIGAGKRTNGLYYFVRIPGNIDISQGISSQLPSCNTVDSVIDVHMIRVPNKPATSVSQPKGDSRNKLDLLHARLGHPSLSKMKFVDDEYCKGITKYNCGICYSSKHHKFPFHVSDSRAAACFDLIHMHIWGSYRVRNLDGASYFLTIVDDHSRITWTYLIHNKLQVHKVVSEFISMVETQFNKRVKKIRSNNGTEIVKESCRSMFASKGILHENRVPYVPQQNGIVERKHRSLLEISRALRFDAGLPKKFWGECILTATHFINKIPSKRDKFDSRTKICLFIGYPAGYKYFKLYDLDTHKVFLSKDVIFFETIFPYKLSPESVTSIASTPQLVEFSTDDSQSPIHTIHDSLFPAVTRADYRHISREFFRLCCSFRRLLGQITGIFRGNFSGCVGGFLRRCSGISSGGSWVTFVTKLGPIFRRHSYANLGPVSGRLCEFVCPANREFVLVIDQAGFLRLVFREFSLVFQFGDSLLLWVVLERCVRFSLVVCGCASSALVVQLWWFCFGGLWVCKFNFVGVGVGCGRQLWRRRQEESITAAIRSWGVPGGSEQLVMDTLASVVLSSSGLAPYNDATLADLQAKHPSVPEPTLPDIPGLF